jgi:hypothetical protein
LISGGTLPYTWGMETKYNPRPASASETLKMLLDRTETGWEGRIIAGLGESGMVEPEDQLINDLLVWRKGGTDAEAAKLLFRLTAGEYGGPTDSCVANVMGGGPIQGRTWLKNALKFARREVPPEMPGMEF